MFAKFKNDRAEPEEANNVAMKLDYAHAHVPASGSTLLPRPVASLISLITQSTSLSLRLGTFFGGAALDGARATTLTSLELSRALVEGILTRAGRDIAIRSGDEHGRTEAESLLERSLATLHTTVTSASFFAAATFHFSSTTLSSISNLSQALLSTLDAILGSTESSRAIAAIITLIRREFRSLEPGANAENIGVGDLLIGSLGFALLQRWGRKNTERHLHLNGGDEIVWDVVILDNGARADVVGSHQLQFTDRGNDEVVEPGSASFVVSGNGEESFDAVRRSSINDSLGRRLSIPLDGQQQVSDEDIRAYIMSQLPQGCHASIRSEALTARTITVDIYDDDTAEIAPPPGTKMIEERFHHDHDDDDTSMVDGHRRFPKHTMVFRTAFNKSQSTQLRPHDGSGIVTQPEPDHPKRKLLDSPLFNSPVKAHHDRPHSHTDTTHDNSSKRHGTTTGSPNEHTKSALTKGAFTKLAQKVKPAALERNEAKQPPPQKPSINSPGSSGISVPRLPLRPTKGTASVKEATVREAFSRPDFKKRQTEPVNYRPTTPVPNRGLRRSPFPNSPQGPSPKSQVKHAPSLELYGSRSPRGGHFAVREKSQESLLTQTDTFLSRRGASTRPGSPTAVRTRVRSSSSMSVTRSETDGAMSANDIDNRPGSSGLHCRSQSYTPSMYSLATAGSETSLLLAHRPRKSAYEDMETIQALNRDGFVPGIFPERHFVQNIRRFCRFSSASYGSNALKFMGVPRDSKSLPSTKSDGHEHSAFSENAGLPPSTILLSSFVDPAGGSNSAGETATGFPLVHYLSIDHDSKAVVLTLRGTWGFEDILTDMTCDYDELEWQGKNWKVHKGMHASAKRLLEGGGGRVMITLRATLEEFPDYGIVLCGHSLGGGVAALLATMISEPSPSPTGTSFVTASYQPATRPRLLTTKPSSSTPTSIPQTYTIPANRPIHVYAYGPPAVMSPFLRLATRGLITTIVNGSDIVPSLSLGILHDMHTASLSFKEDATGAKTHIRQRLRDSLRQSIIHKFYVNQPPLVVNAGDGVGEDAWAWKTLLLLREEMRAPKLMPPGEVFVVETMRVLQRDAFTAPDLGADGYPRLGRPATRVQIRFIRDVDGWFGELRFAGGMLSDHNPARYETSLAALARGGFG